MTRRLFAAAFVFLAASLAFAQAPVAAPTPAAAPTEANYPVGPADVLRIDVFGDTKLSGDYAVAPDGSIVFPLIGQIAVRGKTVGEIKRQLAELLEKDYLFNPQVSVSVREFKSRQVKLLGNVGKPGVYFLDGPTRLFDLLSRAEGIAPRLDELRRGQLARIQRGDGPDAKSIQVDLYDLAVLGKEDSNILLEAGDVIYVPRSESIHVVGEVKKPGTFPYEAGMTVLKAITIAGGTTKKAAPKKTVIKRIVEGKEKRIPVKMEDHLEPEDIVEVPLSFW